MSGTLEIVTDSVLAICHLLESLLNKPQDFKAVEEVTYNKTALSQVIQSPLTATFKPPAMLSSENN